MALTSGINQLYSSAYKALPQKAIPLGSPSTVYEPINQSLNEAGMLFRTFFQVTLPIGYGWASTTNYDVVNLCPVGGNYSNAAANTVNPGYRISQLCLRNSANAGNTIPIFVGFATANNIFNVNANTTAYLGGGTLTAGSIAPVGTISGPTGSTFIQSANTGLVAPVPTGNLFNNSLTVTVLNAPDTLVLCSTTAGALASSTATTIDGYLEYYLTGPTGY